MVSLQCISVISEGLECFGGQGYMEDTGLPVLLRDAQVPYSSIVMCVCATRTSPERLQVTPIWEGTTNILSLDVLRVFAGSEQVLPTFGGTIRAMMGNVSGEQTAF